MTVHYIQKEGCKKGLQIVVDTEAIDSMIVHIESYARYVEMGISEHYKFETDRVSTLEEVQNDVEEALAYLQEIKEIPTFLAEYIDELPKKKNGTFYKGRVYPLHQLEYCTDFWQEYTNAWNLPTIRLKAISDTEARFELFDVQVTH